MPAPPRPPTPTFGSREDHLFPKLTDAQLARIAPHGRRRPTSAGEQLIDVGDKPVPCFVVVSGTIDVLQAAGSSELLIVRHTAGSFSGETNLISGRPSVARLRVAEPGEVIELGREQLLALVQTDA